MATVGVSSGIFRDIFSTEPMRRTFADENRIQKYLDIEAALARAQARLGIIPQDACDEILRHCSIAEYDFAKLKSDRHRPRAARFAGQRQGDRQAPRSRRARKALRSCE